MPRDIKAFFETYRDAFNALDGKAVADLYAEPCGIAQDGTYTRWPSRQSVAENMEALCRLYKDKGFIRARFEPQQFIKQGQYFAVADIQWRIDWSGNQDAWHFNTTYNLMRTAEGWRVLLCTAYSESELVKAQSAAQLYAQPERQRQATRPGPQVHGTLSAARAWRPAAVARLAPR